MYYSIVLLIFVLDIIILYIVEFSLYLLFSV